MKREEDLVPRNYQLSHARWLSGGALGPGREIRKRAARQGKAPAENPSVIAHTPMSRFSQVCRTQHRGGLPTPSFRASVFKRENQG